MPELSDFEDALECLINDACPPMTHEAVAKILEDYARFLRETYPGS